MAVYKPGAILEHSWGHEQTNIDFFVVLKRSGDWLTLQELPKLVEKIPGTFTANETPDLETPPGQKPFRRKVKINERGQEIGTQIHQSYGWADLWNGKPSRSSSYA